MIENISTSKNIIKKIFPYKEMYGDLLRDIFGEIRTHINDNVDSVNLINTKYLESLDTATRTTNNILTELRAVASSYADLAAISGSTNSSYDLLFGDQPVYSSSQMIYNKEAGIIKLNGEYTNLLVPEKVTYSAHTGDIGTSDKKSKYLYDDIDAIFGTYSHVQFENIGAPLLTTITVDLGKEYPLNNVSFNMINLGIGYPEITNIRAYKSDGTYSDVLMELSNSTSIELEKYSFTDGKIFIDFKEVRASKISLTFSQNRSFEINENQERFAFGINALRMGFVSSSESGNIILGPIATTSQILKASIYADTFREQDGNLRFSISFDADNWIDISNAKELFPEYRKVLNINNIEDDSFDTDAPVKEIFLRISMSSVDASYVNSSDVDIEKTIATLSPSERIISTNGSDQNNTNVFEYSKNRYGSSTIYSQGDIIDITDHIISASIDDRYIPFSIGEVEGAIDLSKKSSVANSSNTRIFNKQEKVFVIPGDINVCRPKNSFDPFTLKTYIRSGIIQDNIQTETKDNLVCSNNIIYGLKPTCESGTITIILSNGNHIQMNLSDGFIHSAHNLVIAVEDSVTDAKIYINGHKLIGTVATSVVSGKNSISLYSILGIAVPSVSGREYSYTFPIDQLEENEFCIVDGCILFGSYFKGTVSSCTMVRYEEVLNTASSGPLLGERQILDKSKQIKASYALDGFSFKKVIKLKHTGIIKGSLKFSITNASTNAFVKEIKFIDGISEFNTSSISSDITVSGSEIILGATAQELNGKEYIDFSGKIDLFQNRVYTTDELVEKGDWMLSGGVITLPEDTIELFDERSTTITYSIAPKSATGLYSVDYIEGIVYTNIGADDKTIVSYNYSNVFCKYEALTKLEKSEFVTRPTSVEIIKEIPATRTKYLVTVENSTDAIESYSASPYITNIKLNLITEENFL